eukprot:scaffold47333_cov20-Prasinocladus_malaysianus.AAC.1
MLASLGILSRAACLLPWLSPLQRVTSCRCLKCGSGIDLRPAAVVGTAVAPRKFTSLPLMPRTL